ncbi:FAD-dependent oxidoreductase [Kineosporia sp. NBRC 101731]|uniref:FAD-dependent oxidoreductase n=1 Tax=Kineosporia sp. NBRC 101731 TaxID=3032199 RepID=UPI0024A21FC8|nr:FAD-dependent oxidoreductase [Kineosporia sp. NBRC 101731]GLY29738.1 FAD-dependent oxidoreductase [Kineosporia sp. NBRC 101731]
MPAVENVLVVGAGVAGTGVAILLAQAGVAVDLVEKTPGPTTAGSGITLQGNALRVLRQVGVWDGVRAEGYAFDSLGLRAPDPAGTLLAEIPDARTGGEDLPATVGMPRAELARILIERTAAAGVKIRFGETVTGLEQDRDGVEVTFADGSVSAYDLVIGADGIRSTVRRLVGVDLTVTPVGMGIWRAFGPRPDSVVRTDLYYGGPSFIAGYCPTGENSLYAYIVERAQDRSALSPEERLSTMKHLAQAYHGPWDDIRENLTDASTINYTRFESHVLPAPWNRGRAVLIGDAAHSCPPTLAQGAAMALEDAAVLADLLVTHERVDDVLWDAFTARRFERARTVVEASNQLAGWLLNHERGDVPGLMRTVSDLVTPAA